MLLLTGLLLLFPSEVTLEGVTVGTAVTVTGGAAVVELRFDFGFVEAVVVDVLFRLFGRGLVVFGAVGCKIEGAKLKIDTEKTNISFLTTHSSSSGGCTKNDVKIGKHN